MCKKEIIKSVIFTLFALFFVFPIQAKEMERKISNTELAWLLPANYVSTKIISIYGHEGSHAAMALAFGIKIDTFHVGWNKGFVSFAERDFEEANLIERFLTILAGPAFNRFSAMGIDRYLDKNENDIDKKLRSFLGTACLMNYDMYYVYFYSSFLRGLLPINNPGSDWDIIASVAGDNEYAYYSIFTGLAVFVSWDLYNNWGNIEENYYRMAGMYEKRNLNNGIPVYENKSFNFSLSPNRINFGWTF